MRILLSGLIFLGVCYSHASNFGVFGGLNFTEYDSSVSWERDLGLEGGAIYLHPLTDQLSFRTGAGLVQKNSSIDVYFISVEYSFLYLEVPAMVSFKVAPKIDIFGGLNFDIKVSDDCELSGGSSCQVSNTNSFVFNLAAGGRFNITGPSNIEVILEKGMSEIGEGVEIGTSFIVRYVHDLDILGGGSANSSRRSEEVRESSKMRDEVESMDEEEPRPKKKKRKKKKVRKESDEIE